MELLHKITKVHPIVSHSDKVITRLVTNQITKERSLNCKTSEGAEASYLLAISEYMTPRRAEYVSGNFIIFLKTLMPTAFIFIIPGRYSRPLPWIGRSLPFISPPTLPLGSDAVFELWSSASVPVWCATFFTTLSTTAPAIISMQQSSCSPSLVGAVAREHGNIELL